MAGHEGISLNQFICLAVTERVSRIEHQILSSSGALSQYDNRDLKAKPYRVE